MNTSDHSAFASPAPLHHGPELSAFPDAHVVQLAGGHPTGSYASVELLHPATVMVTADRVEATIEGARSWVWGIDDLVAVHHATDGPWTILAVPGVRDYGVAVRPQDVDMFRTRIDALRPGLADAPTAPSLAPPPPAPLLPPPPCSDPTIELDLDGLASAADRVGGGVATATRPRLGRLRTRERTRPTSGSTGLAGLSGRTDPAALHARSISAWFGDHLVLDRVSLEMEAGRVTALIGPSGCGKSTFLRILNRMHEMIPSAALAGEVLLDGHDIYDPQRKLTDARREIGMVFQKPNPFPAMSIYDNVIASLQLTGTKVGQSTKDELVETCLGKAGLWNEVKDRLRQPGGGLSGGQQQRLCIARALAIRPLVLLMDEPCSALDPTSTRRIEQTITELAAEVTIVIVTHNMQQALRVSNQCAFFLAEQGTPGIIVEHGPTDAMFNMPQDPRTNDYVNGRFG